MDALAFDGRMGASGDMILGALMAAGGDSAVLRPVERALDVEYAVESVVPKGIAATRVVVKREGKPLEGRGAHRTVTEVQDIVRGMELPTGVEEAAVEIFRLLGEAEARVHETTLEDTHFHEVGADDAIADIVGTALLLDDLEVDRIVTTPVAGGGGEVEMSHGTYPVPAPAVIELATQADWELQGGPVEEELLTPTGAAILAYFAEGVDAIPAMRLGAVGYGAGSRDVDGRANVLRVLIGETQALKQQELAVLETNVDDVSPEILGSLHDTLLDSGARDVSIVPTVMKKSRPGHLIKVVTMPEDAHRVARQLAEETGTLGVRTMPASHRWIADRRIETQVIRINGAAYEIDVKIGTDTTGQVLDVSAEFDDASAVAEQAGVPTREVQRRAEAAVEAELGASDEDPA